MALSRTPRLDLLVRCALVAIAAAGAPTIAGCASEPKAALTASSEPSTAVLGPDSVIQVRLMPPQGEWVVKEVEIENAKLVSRDGDAPLQLSIRRSEPKQGETTVEGADEPAAITVTYGDKKTGERGQVIYRVAVPTKTDEGTSVPVTVEW
ncbi:MAG: hypothetical protein HOW73_35030 [Polyangiaceae bacterium]|nr:hypothetical protein [Polyangiaceae bacterium]